ncbi:MAG TPA: nitroreductase family protein [Williamwhitmania sp.]|nr:nitroreductase family protein [Williamwhitmania sp.]
MIKELVYRNRSYRRFFQQNPIAEETLLHLVDLARMSPSGRNLQPLKYAVVYDPEQNAQLFPFLAWAGYLNDWDGPIEGERPSAYIVMLEDSSIAEGFAHDQGIAAQSIMLGAVEAGLGGCILGSIKRKEIAELLHLPENLKPVLVLALGVPKEEVAVELLNNNGDVKYWRDGRQVHHVPKRSLEDIVVRYVKHN